MNDFTNTYLLKREVSREMRRLQAEREHPDAFTHYDIRQATSTDHTMRIRVQTIIANIRSPRRPAPSRHAFS